MKRLDEARERCGDGSPHVVRKILTAQSAISDAVARVDDLERSTEAVAIVYAMRYRDKMSVPSIVLELRSMPPAFWMTGKQVEYLLTRADKAMAWHKNAC